MAKFNAESFFASKGKNARTNVVLPHDGGNFKMRLEGLPKAVSADGLAKLAQAQVEDRVKVARDKVVTDGGLTATRSVEFTRKDAATFITEMEKAGAESAKSEPAATPDGAAA